MKRIFGVVLILFAVACFGFAAYNYVNIEMVVSEKNNELYDGFGEKYVNGKPSSSHTLYTYVSLVGGVVLISSGLGLIKKNE